MTRLSDWSAADIAAKLSGTGRAKSKKSGDQWKAPCPAHDDQTPSLYLKNQNGKLLYHCFGGCDPDDVRQAIEAVLGGESAPERRAGAAVEREKVEDPRKTVFPVPADAHVTIDAFQHSTYGAPSKLWTYKTGDGAVAGWTARYDLGEGRKEVLPFVWSKHDRTGKEEPIMRGFPGPRPLYNLDRIVSCPEATIFFVEGEKSADASEAIFPGWIGTTIPGGSNALKHADLSCLAGRMVVVLPDHDGPGYALMLHLTQLLPMDTDLRMMVWPDAWPDEGTGPRPYDLQKGDDIADHVERGWDTAKLKTATAQSGRKLTHRVIDVPQPFEQSHRR